MVAVDGVDAVHGAVLVSTVDTPHHHTAPSVSPAGRVEVDPAPRVLNPSTSPSPSPSLRGSAPVVPVAGLNISPVVLVVVGTDNTHTSVVLRSTVVFFTESKEIKMSVFLSHDWTLPVIVS